MAILNFCGYEMGDTSEPGSYTGTKAISTTTMRTGGCSMRIAPTGSNVGSTFLRPVGTNGLRAGNYACATLYSSFYFLAATLPATEEEFFVILDDGGSYKAYLTVTSAGIIKAYNNAGSLGGTGTTALSINTWYRIDVKSSTGSGNQPFQVKINGTLELDLSINQLTNNHGYNRYGKNQNLNDGSVDFYYDDLVVCDDAFIGDYAIKRLAPNANGSTMDWTSGTSPSDYTCVDESPISVADYVTCGTGSGDKLALFNFQSCSDAGIAGTIYGIATIASVREPTSGTSSNKHRIKSGSSTQESASGYNATTSHAVTGLLSFADPATGAAWTTSGLDSVEAGLVEANAIAVNCSFYSVMVLYAPSGDITVSPSTLTGTGTLEAPTVVIDATASASELTATGTLNAPTVLPSIIVPDDYWDPKLIATLNVPYYSIGTSVEPATLAATGTLEAPTILTGSSVSVLASTLEATGTLETSTVTATQFITVTPSTLEATGTLNTPTPGISPFVEPAPLAATGTLETSTVTVTLSETIIPGTLTATVDLGTPTILAVTSTTVTPSELTITGTLEASTAASVYDASIAPTTLELTGTLLAPTISEVSTTIIITPAMFAVRAMLSPVLPFAPKPIQFIPILNKDLSNLPHRLSQLSDIVDEVERRLKKLEG